MARVLPELVNKLCYAHNAWLVGGAATQESPKDYDVAVPFAAWSAAAMLIPRNAKPNSFGGWKCESEGAAIDVWPCDLGVLLTNAAVVHLWHPQTGARFERRA
ncbi:MAG TPA: hypothetical protein V6C65_40980 [Allocoleopsis sp.]